MRLCVMVITWPFTSASGSSLEKVIDENPPTRSNDVRIYLRVGEWYRDKKKVSLGEPESLIRSVLGGWRGIWTISPIGDSRRQLIFWTSQEGDDDDGNGEIVFFFIFAGRVTSSSVLLWPTTFQWFPQPPAPLWRSCVCACVCTCRLQTRTAPYPPNCRV
jgi:hypothetical protein